MATTPRRDVPARNDTSSGDLTALRIVALDAWADELYAASIDNPDASVVAAATGLYRLGHDTLTELTDVLDRAPPSLNIGTPTAPAWKPSDTAGTRPASPSPRWRHHQPAAAATTIPRPSRCSSTQLMRRCGPSQNS